MGGSAASGNQYFKSRLWRDLGEGEAEERKRKLRYSRNNTGKIQ